MITAIDTNVIVALWDRDDRLSAMAQTALDESFAAGKLVVGAPVFAELMAAPGRKESFLNQFFDETGILVEWELGEKVWRAAGKAFQKYALRRRQQEGTTPRRILADFLIGAHAAQSGYRLLTLDEHLYQTAFPELSIVRV
jgi:predicted nucleic acid-binding protein